MPNWCLNEVEMYGSEEDIDAIKELITSKESKFDLNKIIPMPEELEGTQPMTDQPNWYDWRLENWGTKWNVIEADVDSGTQDISASFETAWSPPEFICYHLREKFPDVEISWFFREDGMQMAGWL